MNMMEFEKKYGETRWCEIIKMTCSDGVSCDKPIFNITHEKARQNIKRNGKYLCGECAKKRAYEANPMSDLTKMAISETKLGIEHTEESWEARKAEKRGDSTEVYCDYCKETHTIKLMTLRKNIERNGRYICPIENGNTVGKLPKTHRKNPLEAEGKKKCSGECQQILPLDQFSPNGPGKVSSRCKACRAKVYAERYHDKKKAANESLDNSAE